MTPYATAINKLGSGDLDLSSGDFQILYLRAGYTANTGDGGHSTEADLGANISHREDLTTSWSGRTFGATNFQISDPDNDDTVTQIVIVKGSGAAGTNDLVCHQTLDTPVTWDGVPDQQTFDSRGIFRIGAE